MSRHHRVTLVWLIAGIGFAMIAALAPLIASVRFGSPEQKALNWLFLPVALCVGTAAVRAIIDLLREDP